MGDCVLFVERANELAVWGMVKGDSPVATAKASLKRRIRLMH